MTYTAHVVSSIRDRNPETGTRRFQGPQMSDANPSPTRPMMPVKLRMIT